MSYPDPIKTKEFIESLEGSSADSIIKAVEWVNVEEKAERTFYLTCLVSAAAIHLRKRFEVWCSFIQGKNKPAMGAKEYWLKYEGVVIDSWVTKNKPLRESPSAATQEQIRKWALKAMKEARPRKRLKANTVLRHTGWINTKEVSGIVEYLSNSGNEDLANKLETITKGE